MQHGKVPEAGASLPPPQSSSISIVVPMLNEAAALPALLAHLADWCGRGCEIVLVDGGYHVLGMPQTENI